MSTVKATDLKAAQYAKEEAHSAVLAAEKAKADVIQVRLAMEAEGA